MTQVLGHYLISLPFLNDGGPLGDPLTQASLVKHAMNEAKSSGASLLELRHESAGSSARAAAALTLAE